MAAARREVPEHEASEYLDPKWQVVSRGLSLVRWGVLVGLIGFFLVGAVRLWAASRAADALEKGHPTEIIYQVIGNEFCGAAEFAVLVAACLLVLLGRMSCRRLPRATKLRGLVSASVWLTLLAALCYGVLRVAMGSFRGHLGVDRLPVMSLAADVQAVAAVALVGFGLAGLLAELSFLRFLSRVGQQVRSLELVGAVRTFTVLLVAAVVGVVVLACGLAGAAALLGPFVPPGAPTPVRGRVPAPPGPLELADWLPGLLLLSGLTVAVVALLLALAYLNLLRQARETVEDRLPAPEPVLPEPTGHYVRHS